MGLEFHIKKVLEDVELFKDKDYSLNYHEGELYLTTKRKRIRDKIYKALMESYAFNPKKVGSFEIIFLPIELAE